MTTHTHNHSDCDHDLRLWIRFGVFVVNFSSVSAWHYLKWWEIQHQIKTFYTLCIVSAELLEQVHAIGKASKNIFSSAQNFTSFSDDGDSSSNSPVISFKAHLIRLIGNLCHSNTNNQNKVCNEWMSERTEKVLLTPAVRFSWSWPRRKNFTSLPFSSGPVCVYTDSLQTNMKSFCPRQSRLTACTLAQTNWTKRANSESLFKLNQTG